jgi:hypothetical protein
MLPSLHRSIVILVGLFIGLYASPTWAQSTNVWDRVSIHMNGGFQSGSDTVQRTFSFRAYGEDARFREDHETQSGGVFDFGVAAQVWEQLQVGLSYSQVTQADATVLSGIVPHPLSLNVSRTIEQQILSLQHEERAVHLYAAWVVPINDKLDVAISGGPSVFNLTQGTIAGVAISEVSGAPWKAVRIDGVTEGTFKKNGFGLHVAVDVTYMITAKLGLGGLFRFAQGGIQVPSSDRSQTLTVGGVQAGGGLRVRF